MKTSSNQLNQYNMDIEKSPNYENKLSIEEKKNIISGDNKVDRSILNNNNTIMTDEKDLKSVYINNWLYAVSGAQARKRMLIRFY